MTDKYNYSLLRANLKRETKKSGERTYTASDGRKLPSVTTIIGKMSDKSAIERWRNRIGHKEADHITQLSAGIGTWIHTHIECVLENRERPTGTSYVRKIAKQLSDVIINEGLGNLDEIWGIEATLYYPGLYAGTSDVIGVWKGEPAILDFKNTRKPKDEKWLDGYKLQLAAYAMAHDELFGTEINKGVILMVAREEPYVGTYQEFEIDLEEWKEKWLSMLEDFYDVHSSNSSAEDGSA